VGVEFSKQSNLSVIIVAIVTDGSTHDGVVLFFHVAAVVFAVGAATCKSDLAGFTESKQMVVDELTTIVGVKTKHGEGKFFFDLVKGGEHEHLGFGANRACFSPC